MAERAAAHRKPIRARQIEPIFISETTVFIGLQKRNTNNSLVPERFFVQFFSYVLNRFNFKLKRIRNGMRAALMKLRIAHCKNGSALRRG
jgi:hypothetical protein